MPWKIRIAVNEHVGDVFPWKWHRSATGEIVEFDNEVQAVPTCRDLRRADPHVDAVPVLIPDGVDPDSRLPKQS